MLRFALTRNLNGIPIYNLTLAFTDASQYAQLGNLSSYANYANDHAYLNDAQLPQSALSGLLPYARLDAPGLPMVVTEAGYETNSADTYSGVDQTVQAKLTLDQLMDDFKDGVSATYLYELFDEGQQYFGLFNANGSPKLAATAIHNLTSILADPGSTSAFTPGSLTYAVANLPTAGNQLLLEKSNGNFDLVLWSEAQIWNPNTASEVVAPTATSTVQFGQTQKVVLVFDPLTGTAPIAAYLNTQSVQVTLADHPLVIEVAGATPTLATPTINGYSSNGGVAGDSITLTGTALANSNVVVFDGATEIGTAITNASGNWSFATGTLASGTNAFTSLAVGRIRRRQRAFERLQRHDQRRCVGGDDTGPHHLRLFGQRHQPSNSDRHRAGKRYGECIRRRNTAWIYECQRQRRLELHLGFVGDRRLHIRRYGYRCRRQHQRVLEFHRSCRYPTADCVVGYRFRLRNQQRQSHPGQRHHADAHHERSRHRYRAEPRRSRSPAAGRLCTRAAPAPMR